jgi:hypothetical protein
LVKFDFSAKFRWEFACQLFSNEFELLFRKLCLVSAPGFGVNDDNLFLRISMEVYPNFSNPVRA